MLKEGKGIGEMREKECCMRGKECSYTYKTNVACRSKFQSMTKLSLSMPLVSKILLDSGSLNSSRRLDHWDVGIFGILIINRLDFFS